jgi:hypothetical protein
LKGVNRESSIVNGSPTSVIQATEYRELEVMIRDPEEAKRFVKPGLGLCHTLGDPGS